MGLRFDWKWDNEKSFPKKVQVEESHIIAAKELVNELRDFLFKYPDYELPANVVIKQTEHSFAIYLLRPSIGDDRLVLEAKLAKVDSHSILDGYIYVKEVVRFHSGRWVQELKDSMQVYLNKLEAERLERFKPLEED